MKQYMKNYMLQHNGILLNYVQADPITLPKTMMMSDHYDNGIQKNYSIYVSSKLKQYNQNKLVSMIHTTKVKITSCNKNSSIFSENDTCNDIST